MTLVPPDTVPPVSPVPPVPPIPTGGGLTVPRALALLAVVVAAVHHPLFAGRAIYARDIVRWVLPARALLRASLAHGHLPLWNPYEGIGFPVLSDPLYGVFYPPALVTLAAPLVGGAMALLFTHVLWGGAGALLLARRLGATVAGALVAGLAWSLSGCIASDWTSGIRLLSSAWAPWSVLFGLIVANRAVYRAPRWWATAALGAIPAGAVFLAGEVFLATILAGFGAVAGLAAVRASPGSVLPPPRGALARHALAVAIGLTLAPLCGAVAVLPAVRVASATQRAAPLTRALAERVSLQPARLVEFAASGSLGRAYETAPGGDALHYFPHPPLALSVYLGASVLALALLGLSRRRDVVFFAGLAVFSVLVSMGSSTPVHHILRVVVPPLAYMRSPEKYLALVVPLVAVLAALGADRLVRSTRFTPRLLFLPVSLCAVALLARWVYLPGVAPYVIAGALRGAIASGALLGTPWIARRSTVTAGLWVVVVVALDLGLHVHGFHRYALSSGLTAVPALAGTVRADAMEVSPAPPRVFRASTLDDVLDGLPETPTRLIVVRSLEENTSVAYGVAILPGYDAAIPQALQALLHTGRHDALRLLSVDHALLRLRGGTQPDGLPEVPREGYVTVAAPFPRVRLYRVIAPLPRAYLAGSVARSPPPGAEETALVPEVLDGRVALVADPGPWPAPTIASPPLPRTDCVVERYAPGDLTVRCTADVPRLAVLVEQSSPGWVATVDGRPVPWVTANLVACGVPFPAGTHRVGLRYVAPGLATGALVSGVSWAAVALALAASLRVRERRPGTPGPGTPGPGTW